MKTLLKNRRTYRNRIGTPDDEHDTMKKKEGEDEGNNTDSWEDMYQADKERRLGADEEDNGEDGGQDKGEDGADNEDEDEDANPNISGSRGGGGDEDGSGDGDEDGSGDGDEDGSEDGDENNRKERNGSRGVSGRKDNEGRNVMKRKNQDDEPVTRAKRTKGNVGHGGRQAATKPMKKALSRNK
jgi:hypothetical protein